MLYLNKSSYDILLKVRARSANYLPVCKHLLLYMHGP